MKKIFVFFCCALAPVFGYFPSFSLGNSEVIGSLEEGVLIPLPEFTYRDGKTDNGSPCLRYKSRIFPKADFVFIRDVFTHSLGLEEYADWFTQADVSFFPYKDRFFISAEEMRPTMLLQKWENFESYYFQLFFGRGHEGFCCFVHLPKSAYAEEVHYWENFFAEQLPNLIQFIR